MQNLTSRRSTFGSRLASRLRNPYVLLFFALIALLAILDLVQAQGEGFSLWGVGSDGETSPVPDTPWQNAGGSAPLTPYEQREMCIESLREGPLSDSPGFGVGFSAISRECKYQNTCRITLQLDTEHGSVATEPISVSPSIFFRQIRHDAYGVVAEYIMEETVGKVCRYLANGRLTFDGVAQTLEEFQYKQLFEKELFQPSGHGFVVLKCCVAECANFIAGLFAGRLSGLQIPPYMAPVDEMGREWALAQVCDDGEPPIYGGVRPW